ncbi:MAG TPA: response regulator transcription factor, partial [Deinococcales bacterium]|nr:response regulator transcription factor [Deinococcales bacterium]
DHRVRRGPRVRPAVDVKRVLIVEDEPLMAELLAVNLEAEGYEVSTAPDGRAAQERWREFTPDLVVLDLMLPFVDGLEVCRRMRSEGETAPVLFLSARGEPEDRVEGLSVGGDDYVVKPFHLPEFLLRVKNLLRRRGEDSGNAPVYSFGGHRVDYRSWSVLTAGGQRDYLSERELRIFRLFAERAGQVVSREDILDLVWGADAFPSSRTIDNFVVRLRRLFEPDPAHPIYLHTVWGVGYRFTPQGEEEGK